MEKLKFQIKLLPVKNTKSTCYFRVPFSIPEVWGIKKSVKVKAMIDKYFHRGFLMPDGKGNHYTGLKSAIMQELGKKAGDVVDVMLELDTEERVVEIPPELKKLFSKHPKEKKYFDSLSYTHRKEYARWISSAKKEETKLKRLAKMIEMLKEKIKHP
ncbi:MAG: YdeI/OmpD-associated family protein [Ignavibacteriae bacterium]|nr:YdeI/OmpD-associated family protein [Ignavibacteriota bacterium]